MMLIYLPNKLKLMKLKPLDQTNNKKWEYYFFKVDMAEVDTSV